MYLKFDGDVTEPKWNARNDDVMGTAAVTDGLLIFAGSLSLADYGGFAQVRIRNLRDDLNGKTGSGLVSRAMAGLIGFGLRTTCGLDPPATTGKWTEVDVIPETKVSSRRFGKASNGGKKGVSILVGDGNITKN